MYAVSGAHGAAFVPMSFERIGLDPALGAGPFRIVTEPPRVAGGLVHCGRIEVVDASGRIVLVAAGGVAKIIGGTVVQDAA
jgi:hypothetical protein